MIKLNNGTNKSEKVKFPLDQILLINFEFIFE